MTPAAVLRRLTAIANASTTSRLVIVASVAQPTIRRENRSTTTARNSQPSTVGMYVISKAKYKFHIVSRPPGHKGWVTLPRRWVVERSFAWLGRSRRQSRDYEKTTAMSVAFIRVSGIHHRINRLRPKPQGSPFKYRKG